MDFLRFSYRVPYKGPIGKPKEIHAKTNFPNFESFVLRAQKDFDFFVGLFGRLYISTLRVCNLMAIGSLTKKCSAKKFVYPPPPLESYAQITGFI